MTLPLRAGVIGAGVFGGYHAAKWSTFDDVSLTAVLDTSPQRARALAARHGARALSDAAEFWETVDVVSIASPAHSHADWALAALRAGKAVYVEKPLATDLAKADAIAALADRLGLVAACGFLERAAFQAMGLFDVSQAPVHLEAHRMGPPSIRNLDVSVVLDLMIHDLDLALAIGAGEPFAVEAEGRRVVNDQVDQVEAEATFDDGFTARFACSRVADAPRRTMRIVYPTGDLYIDFLSGTFENATGFPLDPAFGATDAGRDRLGASLVEFVRAVRGEVPRPLATAADGVRALDLALAVQKAIEG